jgi:DUF438 domain-containing protein
MGNEETRAGAGTKEELKQVLKRLHEGEDPAEVKKQFREVVDRTTVDDLARAEEELVGEGLPREKLHKLCDVHLALMKEQLGDQGPAAPEGHPIHTLMEEHKMMLTFAEKLREDADKIGASKSLGEASEAVDHLDHVLTHFKESEKHYLREENVLFPYLDKHGVKEPPAVMWMEHDQIRELKKGLFDLYENREKVPYETFAKNLKESAIVLSEMLSNHFFKENNILFQMAMKAVSEEEWKLINGEFAEVGYCCFTPASATAEREGTAAASAEEAGRGRIDLGTGSMTREEIECLFNSMPVDVTFVDADDRVRYFSTTKDRIFVRTKAVIGRKVQMCHPQKSVHVVNAILEDFRAGKREEAFFWITLGGKFIYIRYFPVRNEKGEYLGCLEVTQDLTEIKKLEGQKRLLDA